MNHRGAATLGVIDFPRGGRERFEIMRIVAVKAGDPMEVVRKIDEQPGGARQIGVSDTGWFHVIEGRVDGPRVTDETGRNKVARN